MKEQILGLKRPASPTTSVVLTSRTNPDVRFPITVRRLSMTELAGAQWTANGYVVKYLTGWPLNKEGQPDINNPSYVSPVSLPPIDGQPVYVSEAALRVLARVEAAQVGDDPYSIEDLLGLATVNEYWNMLQDLDEEAIIPKVEKPEGNSGASAQDSA